MAVRGWWAGLAVVCLALGCGKSYPRPAPPGTGGSPPETKPSSCTPTTCAAHEKNCGSLSDGCGGSLDCGACSNGQTCGGGGSPNICGNAACTPKTCAALSATCGTVPDGCGGTVNCGTCADGQTCGGGGTPNVCGGGKSCTPTTCAAQGKNCGTMNDGCGGTLTCGTCTNGMVCGAAGVANICGMPIGPVPGPWTQDNVTYGAANGIREAPVVGTTTDETQNLWVATHGALYLLKPGETGFRRFDAASGLHLQSNPVKYCDNSFGDKACPIYGAASAQGITEIVGGGANEVFVGYAGTFTDGSTMDWNDPDRHSGKVDRVRVNADGTLTVDRFDMVSGASAQFWHNRTVQRMIYDHVTHRHELYVGTNHGVDLIRPDLFRYPRPGEWFNAVNLEWMADHLHPRACYHATCTGTEKDDQRMGEWRGLALTPAGDLWVAGRWSAGLIRWDASLSDWFNRPGGQAFLYAFGDPFPPNPPVFSPRSNLEGDPVDLTAVTVAPDGRVWFSSAAYYGGSTDVAYGVASFDGKAFKYYDPVRDLGMAEQNVLDLVALPDGRLVVAGPNTGLVIWNPATGEHKSIRAGQGIPDDRVTRLELDTMVTPPALHVSTAGGAAVLRKLP